MTAQKFVGYKQGK